MTSRTYGYPPQPHDPARCAEEVVEWIPNQFNENIRQCRNKPGHGEGGLFCKRHSDR